MSACAVCLEDFDSLRRPILVGDCLHTLCHNCIVRLYREWSTDAPSRERAVLNLTARYESLRTDALPLDHCTRTLAFACPSCDVVGAAPHGWVSQMALFAAMSTQLGDDAPPSTPPPMVAAGAALTRAAVFSTLLADADDAPLVCPHAGCGALLAAPRSKNASTEPTVGRPRDCGHCGIALCVDCGESWDAPVTGADPSALSHSHFATCDAFAEEKAVKSEVLPAGTKQCPGCMKVVTRLRNDACHNVTCDVCTTHFCIVCLMPSILFGIEEHLCPHDCSHNACDCDHDPSLRPEAADVRAARLVSQAQGIAVWKRANPGWGGPVSAATIGARRVARAVRDNALHNFGRDGGGGEDDAPPVDGDATSIYSVLRRIEDGDLHSVFSLAAAARAFNEGDGCTLRDQLGRRHRPAELLAFLNGRADDASARVPLGGLPEVRAQVLSSVCAQLSSSPRRAPRPTRATALLRGWARFADERAAGATDVVSIARAKAALFQKIGLLLIDKKLTRETTLTAALVFSAVPTDALSQWLDDGLALLATRRNAGEALAETWLASVLHFLPPLLALRASTSATGDDEVADGERDENDMNDVNAPLLSRLERFAALAETNPAVCGTVLQALTLSFAQPESSRTILHAATSLLAPTLVADRRALIDLMVTAAREDAWTAAASVAERLRVASSPLTQTELLADVGRGETLLSLALASRAYERSALGSAAVAGAKNAPPQVGKDGFADAVARFMIERDAEDPLASIFGWEQ